MIASESSKPELIVPPEMEALMNRVGGVIGRTATGLLVAYMREDKLTRPRWDGLEGAFNQGADQLRRRRDEGFPPHPRESGDTLAFPSAAAQKVIVTRDYMAGLPRLNRKRSCEELHTGTVAVEYRTDRDWPEFGELFEIGISTDERIAGPIFRNPDGESPRSVILDNEGYQSLAERAATIGAETSSQDEVSLLVSAGQAGLVIAHAHIEIGRECGLENVPDGSEIPQLVADLESKASQQDRFRPDFVVDWMIAQGI